MKPTEPNLWDIHASKTGDADNLFLQKQRYPASRFCKGLS